METTTTMPPQVDDWRLAPELPTAAEIMAPQPPPLPQNPLGSPPGNKAKYLERQYRLLRHEGVELLRRSVQEFRANPNMSETNETAIYTNVTVLGYTVTRLGAICRISFCPTRIDKRIRWSASPRLTPGSLIAISPADNAFKSICMVAIVAQRFVIGGLEPDPAEEEPPHTPPRIDIAWADPNDAIFDPTVEFIMIEAKTGFYESVRHTLAGLQVWEKNDTIFDKYLIKGTKNRRLPAYIEELGGVIEFGPAVKETKPARRPEGATKEADGADGGRISIKANVKQPLPSSLMEATGLDRSQLGAIQHILTTEVAVVQGPPGTGKTFTSVTALKILLHNLDYSRPIIISAQTNHALDQILSLCYKATKLPFIRLGRRSKDEFIGSRTIYRLKQCSKTNYGGGAYGRLECQRKGNVRDLTHLVKDCFPDGLINPAHFLDNDLITQSQYDSIVGPEESEESDPNHNPLMFWLRDTIEPWMPPRLVASSTVGWEEPDDFDMKEERSGTLDDEETNRLSGEYIPISECWVGRVRQEFLHARLWKRVKIMLQKNQDLYAIPRDYRGAVYRYLRNQFVAIRTENFRDLLRRGVTLANETKACRFRNDAAVIQEFSIPIVGCTTTGLTKYRGLIEELNPRIMLIEEAAETREANITSALFKSLEQLILVGDHMQLAPHTDVTELAGPPYNLHVSLFERLVNLRLAHSVLSVQRRMIPEIRSIISPFYPTLGDHESVLDPSARPPVPGMGDVNTYFFCHKSPEDRHRNSRVNYDEAAMIVGFVRYLVLNGTPAPKITVLTFYRGQRGLIYNDLTRDPILRGINPQGQYNVCTVDGYQGEENDVVILSLVRSPPLGAVAKVGFLVNQNRAVVAMSRARRAFYIFGNYWNLMRASPKSEAVWKASIDVLAARSRCHRYLPIKCQRHGQEVKVVQPDDWYKLHGGCRHRCEVKLGCGHQCQLLCHPTPHEMVNCRETCARKLPCGHGCSARCGDRCKCKLKCKRAAKKAEKKDNFVSLDDMFGDPDKKDGSKEKGAVVNLLDDEDDLISLGGSSTSSDTETTPRDSALLTNPSLSKSRHPSTGATSPVRQSRSDEEMAKAEEVVGPNEAWATWNAKQHDLRMKRQNQADAGHGNEDGGATSGENEKQPAVKYTFKRIEIGDDGRRETVQVSQFVAAGEQEAQMKQKEAAVAGLVAAAEQMKPKPKEEAVVESGGHVTHESSELSGFHQAGTPSPMFSSGDGGVISVTSASEIDNALPQPVLELPTEVVSGCGKANSACLIDFGGSDDASVGAEGGEETAGPGGVDPLTQLSMAKDQIEMEEDEEKEDDTRSETSDLILF